MIDEYVARLRREVRGPLLPRRSMLRELRDGLLDAADAHRSAGATRAEAERLAVEEFGPVPVVAAEVRAELAAVAARYLAGLIAVLGSVQFALSTYTWTTAAAEQGWPEPAPWYGVLSRAVDISSFAFVGLAAVAVLALGRGARLWPTRRVVRVIAVVTLVDVGVHVVSGVVLSAFAPATVGEWDGSWLAVMSLLSVGSTLWITWLAVSCLRLTSRRSQDGVHDGAHLAPGLLLRG
ncbi:permease prefix domain 1-containing protein [Jiangella endophytica]|uniref:permease prefix domain 1-containing protein n=1 Tax=Jiangella endophytica TaxID=1623398 RepID=UPI000E34D946|nr:permease prefix domain 1-containing protein [Jiangella endophytica]